jgi:hypothetical protein
MGTIKKSFIYLLSLSILSVSCSKDEEVVYDDNVNLTSNKIEVIETYTSKLPKNVTKIEKVTSNHPTLLNSRLISKNLNDPNSKSSGNENAIYYFDNEQYATLSYNGANVYASVFDENNIPIENLVADFSEVESNNIVTIEYLDTGITDVIQINSTNKDWGSCMDDAIDQLYDDWNDDPVGTFTCWVTGPLCAIGGGIACGIQQL